MRERGSCFVLGCALALVGGCEREPAKATRTTDNAAAASETAQRATVAAPAATPAPETPAPPPPPPVELGAAHGLISGALSDVGPAAPAAGSALGAVLITRDDGVQLARATRPAGRTADAMKLAAVDEPQERFAPFGRGPSLLGDHAYWISKGRLLRRRVDGDGGAETLARDARDGTRVVAAQAAEGAPVAVAYLARGADRIVARLWVEGGNLLDLSPEGAAASSVTLVRARGGLVALALEGRTSMTPVHARAIRFDGARAVLAEDVVVWVGGSAQPLTELAAVAADRDIVALVPMEQDATHFGLVRISVDLPPRMTSRTSWQLYPNGLDPAPVAAAEACGRRAVVFARPAEPQPRAPQELVLAVLGTHDIGPPAVLARARAFVDVSLAAVDGGILAVWVADHRTWALPLGCRPAGN